MPRTIHLPATGNYAYATIFFEGQAKIMSCKLWFTASGPVAGGFNASAFAVVVDTALSTDLPGVMSNEGSVIGIKISVRNGLMEYSGRSNLAHPGTVVSPPLPDDVSAVVRRQSDQPGQSGRGRIFIPLVPESFVDENRFNGTATSPFAALEATLMTAITFVGITWSPAHFEFKLGQLHAVVSFKHDINLGTQRHRRPRF
jgi:hypothetical protein